MKTLWRWLKAHIVWLKVEKPTDHDSKGWAVGFRFWF
jgi:hypothetical protein